MQLLVRSTVRQRFMCDDSAALTDVLPANIAGIAPALQRLGLIRIAVMGCEYFPISAASK